MALRERWSHKQGTPETLEQASRTQQGALARLYRTGALDANQLAAAEENQGDGQFDPRRRGAAERELGDAGRCRLSR